MLGIGYCVSNVNKKCPEFVCYKLLVFLFYLLLSIILTGLCFYGYATNDILLEHPRETRQIEAVSIWKEEEEQQQHRADFDVKDLL